jgi:hypothetical protein
LNIRKSLWGVGAVLIFSEIFSDYQIREFAVATQARFGYILNESEMILWLKQNKRKTTNIRQQSTR